MITVILVIAAILGIIALFIIVMDYHERSELRIPVLVICAIIGCILFGISGACVYIMYNPVTNGTYEDVGTSFYNGIRTETTSVCTSTLFLKDDCKNTKIIRTSYTVTYAYDTENAETILLEHNQ